MLPPGAAAAPGALGAAAAPGGGAGAAEALPAKKQAVVDRLRRRIESYRRRQMDFMPRFGQSFNGFCEQNIQETLMLKQKFLENKSKRAAKKQEKKCVEGAAGGGVVTQQKFLKRPADDLDNSGDYSENGPKIPCGSNGTTSSASANSQRSSEGLTKFSVEIVQQLEFTTSAANVKPQQISANVTVKALTNTSVKSDVSSSPAPPPPMSAETSTDLGHLVECKQEPDSEFVDLEQCAAALEKDVQNNGSFPGFSDLMGDEATNEIITSDAFKDLISEIELMKDFDFGENHGLSKQIDSKDGIVQQYAAQFESNAIKPRMPSNYSGLDFANAESSPAAQTLKQMAEQHQHKTQLNMALGGNRPPRSPYGDYQFHGNGDYLGSPKSQGTSTAPQPEIKQEVVFSQSQSFQSTNIRSPQTPKGTGNMMGSYKQQYSPYGSPGGPGSNPSGHGSPGPGYMSRGQGPASSYVGPGSTPPRPPSVNTGSNVQMSQAQQMKINQQSPGPHIQVSAGQHLHLSADPSKANTNQQPQTISIAAHQQQGLYFTASADNGYTVSQSQTINFTQQNLRQRGPAPPPGPPTAGVRPPPPEYKAQPGGMMRFPPQGVRRGVAQQPIPPSGPMMRPHLPPQQQFMGSMQQNRLPGFIGNRPPQQPPSNPPQWRHPMMSMSQQQSLTMVGGYGGQQAIQGPRTVFNQSNFPMQNMHMQQMQQMQQRGPIPMQQMMQNQLASANTMSMNMQMSQNQTMSMGSNSIPTSNSMQYHAMQQNNTNVYSNIQSGGHSQLMQNGGSSIFPSSSELGLEFLDNLTSDSQDFLGCLDGDSNSFNINDIL